MDSRAPLNLAGVLVAAAVLGTLAFLAWALVYRAVPSENREPLLMLIGGFLSLGTGVVGFFFGSSQSSRLKDSALERQATTMAALTPHEPAIPVGPGESVTVKGEGT